MLTATQLKVFTAIHEAIVKTGSSPSYQELAAATGTTHRGALHTAVGKLVERGFIRRIPKAARALEIIRMPPSLADVCPTCGHRRSET